MNSIRRLITSDIPFARDDAHRLLPSMIACLVGFAALLLATSLSLNNALDRQAQHVAGIVQVGVPAGLPASVVEKVAAQLKKTNGVEDVTVINRSEMEVLLKPWLGSDFSLNSLPLPTLLELKTSADSKVLNIAVLQKTLAAIHDGIEVTDRGPWASQLASALNLLQALVVLVAGLLLICVVGMVVLVARTNLKLHFKTVGLLHMFGATDSYILRQFQWNSAWLAARGAVAGVLFAAGIFLAAVILSTRLQSPVIPVVNFTFLHGLAFLLLPLFTAFVALAATRVTVKSMLWHMH
jgi:cell division transport system permease protein